MKEYKELIEALRHCTNDLPCETESYRCKYADIWECNVQLRVDAADAIEAAEKRIAELSFDNKMLKNTIDADKGVMLDRIRFLEAQLPKDAHWVAVENGHGVCSNCNRQDSIDNMATHCRYCGAKMKGANDEN